MNMQTNFELLVTEIAKLKDRLSELEAHTGWVEQHQGDALTDAIKRLATVENSHGEALISLGQRLERLSNRQPLTQDQPAAAIRGEQMSLPPGSFLGDIPCRYGSEIGRYQAAGGNFDPSSNSIEYGHGDMVRFYFLSMVFDLIKKDELPGQVAEIGVWKGDTAVLLANFAKSESKTIYLLDTFEGFDDRDLRDGEKHLSGRFGGTSVEHVRGRLNKTDAVFVRGYFPETANQLPAESKYCLVHIDVDLYAPIKAALEYFYPRMVVGGFIVIHDYMSLCWDGAIKAIDEFFADKSEFIIPVPDLAGSVTVRKSR